MATNGILEGANGRQSADGSGHSRPVKGKVPSVGRVVLINGSPSEAVHVVPSSRVERGLAGSRISGHRSGGCNIEDAARPGSDVTVVLQVEG